MKNLTKPAKKSATKALTELGMSIRTIADILGIDQKTAMKYRSEELSEEWENFATTIKRIYIEQDFKLTKKTFETLMKKIPSAKFPDLITLFKTVRDVQKPTIPTTAVQVNFNQRANEDKEKYKL